MPRLTAAQIAAKSHTLGASAFPVLAGVSPYQTPFELYLEQIGELDRDAAVDDATRDRMERGHRFEDVALDWHAEREGIQIERVHRDIVHPRLPFVVVHPDARVRPWRTTRRLLEAKTGNRRWDEVPQHVEAQVQAQMAATGAESVTVVLQTFDGPPYPYEVARNDELIAGLEALAESFWSRVQRRDPPPIDGSRSASRFLDRMWREGPEVHADADQARVLARLIEVRATVKALEAEDDEIVNLLKFSLAGAPRMYAPGVGRVLQTAPSERRTTAWREVANDYRVLLQAFGSSPEDLDALVEPHTKVAEGVSQFRVTKEERT